MRTAMMGLITCGMIVLSANAERPAHQLKEGGASELVGPHETPDRDQIAKKVDFAKETLLYLQWNGVANDELEVTLDEGRVVFRFTPGTAKNKENHHRVFAVAKNAKWRLIETTKSNRTPRVTEINSAEELAKAIPATK